MGVYKLISYSIKEIPDHLWAQDMYIEAAEINPWQLGDVPDHSKTQKMCEKAVRIIPYMLDDVPDRSKTQNICDTAVPTDPWLLNYVRDCFVTQGQVKIWHDDDYYHDDELIEWYKGYKRRKFQKAKIIEELMPIA